MTSAAGAVVATGCVVRRVALGGDEVKSLLMAPILSRSQHFVLQGRSAEPLAQQLPTGAAPNQNPTVDKVPGIGSPGLALVVPKRLARRAVTRNLIKRQMREVVRRQQADWAALHLLIRQRVAFDVRQYPSAASSALRAAVRGELEQLFERAGAAR
jgi:ribonuclease P protein component